MMYLEKIPTRNCASGKAVIKKMVGMTSDGASVNTGIYGGLSTRMKNDDRDWLITIHCVLHRTELAIKDSLLKTEFSTVHDFMVTLNYLFKNSGKLKRNFYNMGKVLDAQVYNFPKVHGTRFVSHQRRGVHHLLHNWIILAHTVEDCIENNRVTAKTAKLRGVLKKLKDFNFLSICVLFVQMLDNISKFSLCLQKDDLLISEVLPAVEKTKAQCVELGNSPSVLSDLGKPVGFHLIQTNEPGDDTPPEYELQKKILKAEHQRRKKNKRESITLMMRGLTYVQKARDTVTKLKTTIVADVNRCLDERFTSLNSPIFSHINRLINPANWCDIKHEIQSLEYIAKHFAQTLNFSMNNFDVSKLIAEWKDLKLVVKHNYQGIDAKMLWNKVFVYRRSEFQHLCLVMEILLRLGPSIGVVESGFSHLTGVLNDRRLSLSHGTIENLLMITINDLVWSDKDRVEILDNAVKKYMSKKRRKVKLDQSGASSVLGASSRRRKRQKQNLANSVAHITGDSSASGANSSSDVDSDDGALDEVIASETESESMSISDSDFANTGTEEILVHEL